MTKRIYVDVEPANLNLSVWQLVRFGGAIGDQVRSPELNPRGLTTAVDADEVCGRASAGRIASQPTVPPNGE